MRRVGDFVESRANLLGSTFAVGGLGVHLATVAAGTAGLGALWPAAVAGLYGVGAALSVLAPRRTVDLRHGSGIVDTESLRRELATLQADLARNARRLPEDVSARTDALVALLTEVLGRVDTLAASPEHLFVVSQTIRDYLPTSLEAYLNLPRTYALTARVEGRRTAHEELLTQLDQLRAPLEAARSAVYAGDLDALRNQGVFLREKFARSELDLGP